MSKKEEVFNSAFEDNASAPKNHETARPQERDFSEIGSRRSPDTLETPKITNKPKTEPAKTSLYLDPDLMIRIKVFCAKNRCKMTSFFTEAAEAYLSANIKEE